MEKEIRIMKRIIITVMITAMALMLLTGCNAGLTEKAVERYGEFFYENIMETVK